MNPVAIEEIPFGQWLRQQLADREMTQSDLAYEIGNVTPSVVHNLVSGKTRPSWHHAKAIAGAFGMSPEEVAAVMRLPEPDTGPKRPAETASGADRRRYVNDLVSRVRMTPQRLDVLADHLEAWVAEDHRPR